MSVQAITWAISAKTGSPSAKAVLLALANYADDAGKCWPSQARIASDTEQSIDSVQRRLRELEAKRLLIRTEWPGQRGRWGGTVYTLQMTSVEIEETIPQSAVPQSAVRQEARDHTADTSDDRTALLRYKPSVENRNKNRQRDRAVAKATRPVVADQFQEFWEVYPKRDGSNPKAPARKLFSAAVKAGHDPTAIIAAAETYAAAAREAQQFGTKFVAQAMTWLRQGRWEDYQPNAETVEKTGPPPGLTEQQQRDWERGWRPGMPSGEELSRRVNGKAVGDDREADRSERPDHGGKLLASGTVCHAPDWI